MSVASCHLTEEQLWCCICLDVFSDPVTLACGHNFCRSCIMEHLSSNSDRRCPMCKERVDRKQKLGVNTFISELAAQYRQSAGRKHHTVTQGTPSPGPPAGPRRVSLKSYLLAFSLMSLIFCLTANIYFHQFLSCWETSVEKSSEGVCPEHKEPLELYCKDDQVSICLSCRASSHRFHQVVPLRDQHKEKKVELWKTGARIQQMIQIRRLKIQELQRLIELNEEAADREELDGVRVFSSLIQVLEQAQAELVEVIEDKQKAAEKQAEGFISELDQEVSELVKRHAEVEQLSSSKDPVHFLQNLPGLNTVPPTKDLPQVSVCPVAFEGLMRTALVRAVNQLTENVRGTMKKLQDAEMKNFPKFSVDVTLDRDSAHPALVLSDDGKQVHCSKAWRKPPGDPKGPEPAFYVLGKQGFSCGRFHFDVVVKGKTAWTIGVVRESVSKNLDTKLNPGNGCWAVRLQSGGEYVALDPNPVPLSVDSHPEKIRVFVDHQEGLVSFYDADAAALLHSFSRCSFTEKLFPFFSPGPNDGGRNSAPLSIASVRQRL